MDIKLSPGINPDGSVTLSKDDWDKVLLLLQQNSTMTFNNKGLVE